MSSQATAVAARVVAGVLVINLFVYLLAGIAMGESRSRYLRDGEVARQNIARSLASSVSATLERIDIALSNVATQVERGRHAGAAGAGAGQGRAIIGLAHILRRDDAAPGHERRLEQIELSGEHLLSLVNDVLDLSKIEAGRLDLEDGVFRLGAVIDAAASMMQPQATARGGCGWRWKAPIRSCCCAATRCG